jgi:hypothetical protein
LDENLELLSFQFKTTLIHWRGPAPFFFAPIPPQYGAEIKRVSKLVSYGWGVIPVEARIDRTVFRTSLFPKDDSYLVPVKDKVRRTIGITAGDMVTISMTILWGNGKSRG